MSLPQVLLFGRTSGGVNVPVLVDADGVIQTSDGFASAFDQDLNTDDDVTFATVVVTGETTLSGNLTLANGKALRPSTTTAQTALLQAYDVDGTAYKTFATLLNGNVPRLTISQPAGGLLVFIPPTSDPGVTGALWNNAGTLAISA